MASFLIIFICFVLRLDVINYFQAFSFGFLDKMFLATLSIEEFIFYLGVIRTIFYYKYEKTIFFIILIINIAICSAVATIYILFSDLHILRPTNRKNYYCGKYSNKKMVDTIFNSFYLVLSFYYSVIFLLFFISLYKKRSS